MFFEAEFFPLMTKFDRRNALTLINYSLVATSQFGLLEQIVGKLDAC